MTAAIALAVLVPVTVGLAYALWQNRGTTATQPRADGYANEWAAQKAQRPHTSQAR